MLSKLKIRFHKLYQHIKTSNYMLRFHCFCLIQAGLILVLVTTDLKKEVESIFFMLFLMIIFISIRFIWSNIQNASLDVEAAMSLIMTWQVYLFMQKHLAFDFEITCIIISCSGLFLCFTLSKPWQNLGCNQLKYKSDLPSSSLLTWISCGLDFVLQAIWIQKCIRFIFMYLNQFSMLYIWGSLVGVLFVDDQLLALMLYSGVLSLLFHLKMLSLIIPRNPILAAIATETSFCCSASKAAGTALAVVVVTISAADLVAGMHHTSEYVRGFHACPDLARASEFARNYPARQTPGLSFFANFTKPANYR